MPESKKEDKPGMKTGRMKGRGTVRMENLLIHFPG